MRWREIVFKPVEVPLLTSEVASKALEAVRRGEEEIRLSLDLGLSEEQCEVSGRSLVVRGHRLDEEGLSMIAEDDRSIYTLGVEGLGRAEVRSEHFYKLVKTTWGHAPTLEIDGIHMHRLSGTSPEEDASSKVGLAGRIKGARVLDTCMGLGYTAIAALEKGAGSVVTVEKDENVLSLAAVNPWSRKLASGRIKTIMGDVSDYITTLPSASIDLVIHDPPRLALAGELYSAGFYSEIARVLRLGGELIHYVGLPGHMAGKRVYIGVMRRLREHGLAARWEERLGVVYAYKARPTR